MYNQNAIKCVTAHLSMIWCASGCRKNTLNITCNFVHVFVTLLQLRGPVSNNTHIKWNCFHIALHYTWHHSGWSAPMHGNNIYTLIYTWVWDPHYGATGGSQPTTTTVALTGITSIASAGFCLTLTVFGGSINMPCDVCGFAVAKQKGGGNISLSHDRTVLEQCMHSTQEVNRNL